MTSGLDPQTNIYCLLFQLEHSLTHEIMDSLTDVGITPLQLQALAELAIEPGLSTADLARYTRVTPQNMSLAISKLVRKGLVVRRAHARNARIQKLDVTAQGRRVFDRAAALARKVEGRAFGELSASEKRSLVSCLQRSLAKFEDQS